MRLVNMDQDLKSDAAADRKITLLLSGGGFRAALFHLGVIRCLYESGRLKDVDQIFSVSGGSILSAFFGTRWDKVLTRDGFNEVAASVIQYAQSDVRGRILRRHIACLAALVSMFLGLASWMMFLPPESKFGRFILIALFLASVFVAVRRPSLVDKFSRDLDHFLRIKGTGGQLTKTLALNSLGGSNGNVGPKIRLIATDLTTGAPWVFSHTGVSMGDADWKSFQCELYSLANAVTASAAFPPLFSPVRFDGSVDRNTFPINHFLADGGVYDNLGIVAASSGPWKSDSQFIVSNAEPRFEKNVSGGFRLLVQRALRSSNIQMNRASTLHSQLIKCATINLADELETLGKAIPVHTQRLIRNVRTDLNAFSIVECQLLYFKGYLTSWATLDPDTTPLDDFEISPEGVPLKCKAASRWLPFENLPTNQASPIEELMSDSHRNKALMFSFRDRRGSFLLTIGMLAILTLNPVSWWIARFLWNQLPSNPSVPVGNWYSFARDNRPEGFPESADSLILPLLQGVQGVAEKLVPDEHRVVTRAFVSDDLSKSYGIFPRGRFECTFSMTSPFAVAYSQAYLLHSDSRISILTRSVNKDGSLSVSIPPGSGNTHLVVVLSAWNKEGSIEESKLDSIRVNNSTVTRRIGSETNP